MPEDDIANLTQQLEALELAQQEELDALLEQHCKTKRQLLRQLTPSKAKKASRKPKKVNPTLSGSNQELKSGDTVVLQTTASTGVKGDIAKVLYVSPNRVDITIPRLRDTTWRKPCNLLHPIPY